MDIVIAIGESSYSPMATGAKSITVAAVVLTAATAFGFVATDGLRTLIRTAGILSAFTVGALLAVGTLWAWPNPSVTVDGTAYRPSDITTVDDDRIRDTIEDQRGLTFKGMANGTEPSGLVAGDYARFTDRDGLLRLCSLRYTEAVRPGRIPIDVHCNPREKP